MCIHTHTHQPLVERWCLKHMYLFSCTYFTEQMKTYITGKLRDLPLEKSMKDWIIKARPLEASWAYLSHTIILPPKYTVSPLTTGRTCGCFPNMPFPHRGAQAVAVCQSSMDKLITKYLFMTPLVLWQGSFNWEEGSSASSWSWWLARIIQGHVNPSEKYFLLPS